MLAGYPDANLVTAAGGVLVHVENRPANAAHVLHLNPGDIATADVESSALDINGSGNPCPREGTLVVTPPGDSVSHELPVALPICRATISSSGLSPCIKLFDGLFGRMPTPLQLDDAEDGKVNRSVDVKGDHRQMRKLLTGHGFRVSEVANINEVGLE